MTIHLATDHAGFELKELIKTFLQSSGHTVIDHGPGQYVSEDDYPDYIIPAVQAAVSAGELAIVLGSTGQGEAIAANKAPGARAVVYYGGSEEILRLSREHNNANVLSLGASFLNESEVKNAINTWLSAEWSNDERHVRRLKKIWKFHKGIYPRVGIGVVIKNDENKVLFGKRIGKHDCAWAIPGGHVDKGDSIEQTAIKEVKEETGLDIKFDKVLGHTEDFYDDDKLQYISFYTLGIWQGGEPQLLEPEKCAEWRWFGKDELPDDVGFSLNNFMKDNDIFED